MVSPIEGLPVEVFDIIILALDLEANDQLRLTCRRLRHLGLSTYAKRHFSTLTTTLGSPSLDRLVHISKHVYFHNIATEINVKLLTSTDYNVMEAIRKVGIYPPPKRLNTITCVKMADIAGESTLCEDVLNSDSLQCITDRLTRILKNLKNLKAIRFRAFDNEPEWWQGRPMPVRDQTFRSKCLGAVLDSIIKSDIQLDDFCMAKKPKKNSLRKAANIPVTALQLPPPMLTSLQHAFLNLRSLTVTTSLHFPPFTPKPGWELGPYHIIACAPNLKHLALSFDHASNLLSWASAVIRSLAKSCRLSALESFRLFNCYLHEADLHRFVTAHDGTLRELTVNNVRLSSGSWISYWASLKGMRNLRSLRFGLLQGTDLKMVRYRAEVANRKKGKVRKKVVLDTKVSSRLMCDMLDDLIASSTWEWPSAIVDADEAE
jgi:hypothetical protein